MMRFFIWVVPATLLIIPRTFAVEGINPKELQTLTIDQAIGLALQRNIDIALAQDDLETFHSYYRQAIGAVFGDFKATASYTRNLKKPAFFMDVPPAGAQKIVIGADNAFSAGVGFDQPLFSGGRLTTGVRAGKKQIEVGEEMVRGAREDVIFAVKQYFFSNLLAKSTVDIQNDNLSLANEHLATIQERFKKGLDSDLTVLRQQVEVADAKTMLIQARNAEDLSVTNLQKVLYLDVDQPLKPEGELRPPSGNVPDYEHVVGIALKRNSSLSIVRKNTLVAKDLYKIYKADHFPDIRGFADYLWSAQSNDFSPGSNERNDSFGAGVKFEWKFMTWGETHQRVQQARIAMEKARNEETKTEREIRVAVKQQWLNVREALERAHAQETAVGQAKRALEATEVRYKVGRASQLELNDATFAFNRARTQFAQASHDYWIARAGLERVTGASLEDER